MDATRASSERNSSPGPRDSRLGNNWENFIAAVRSRKQSELNAPINEGAISTTILHLANISYRVGRTVYFDEATYSCTGDAEANALFERQYRPAFTVPKIA